MNYFYFLLILDIVIDINGNYFQFSCPTYCVCERVITNCANRHYNDLPERIDPNVKSLDLSYNDLEIISPKISELKDLKILNLSHNKISTIDYDFFYALKDLEYIDLSYNEFHDWIDIRTTAFKSTNFLSHLDLSGNPLKTIPSSLKIPSLETLILNNCSILTINDFIPNSKLKRLELSYNYISVLSTNISSRFLEHIDLSNSHIKHISPYVFFNTNLITLSLNSNKELRNLTLYAPNLKNIDLTNCNLEFIPYGNLHRLNELNLYGNTIGILESRSYFSNLEKLNLSYNLLTKISTKDDYMFDTIKELDLSYNKLKNFNLFKLKSIEVLNLSRNYINNLDFLSHLTTLQKLDVSYNELENLVIYTLSPLEELTARKNFINQLSLNIPTLKLLDISSCSIKSINNKTFRGVKNLRSLNMANNNLMKISPKYLPTLEHLDITNNPWKCICDDLGDMYKYLIQSHMSLMNLICDQPETAEGKTWYEVCRLKWDPPPNYISPIQDSLLWYFIGIVLAMAIALLLLVIYRKFRSLKKERLRLIEEQRREEERQALCRMQIAQREAREEVNRNAPDPRELQRPPSYHEAMLLPRLDSSHLSLAGSTHSVASRQTLNASNPDVSKKSRTRRKRRRRSHSQEGHRASRVLADSEISDKDETYHQTALESDF